MGLLLAFGCGSQNAKSGAGGAAGADGGASTLPSTDGGGGALGSAGGGGGAGAGGGGAGGSTAGGGAGGSTAGGGAGGSAGDQGGGSGGADAPTSSAGCNQSFAPGTLVKTFDVMGVTRQAAFYVPQSYTGAAPLPLVFTLHGSGDSGPNALNSMFADFKKLADARGFLVASLSGYNGLWDVGLDPARPSDPAFATAVLDWVGQNLCLDAKRVFSTGFSGGARESSYLPCALPGRFRAIAPVAGVRHDPPCGLGGVSVMAVHGTADTQNIYGGCTGPCRGGEWGESVEAAVADWVASDGCTGAPTIESVSATVERQTWSACAGGTEVVFYKVAGGTHMWNLLPNIATEVVDFFLAR